MQKCVNMYFTKEIDFNEKIELFKKNNFDGVLVGFDDCVPFVEGIKLITQKGLYVEMVHCHYGEEKTLNSLWTNSKEGDELENKFLFQIKECKKANIENFVIHASASKDVALSKIGLERIKRLLYECQKNNMFLCIENTFSLNELEYIFNNIDSDNLMLCYDSGHENFLTQGAEMLKKFANKVKVVHLHDNWGKTDEHMILGEGGINVENLAYDLSKCKNLEALTAEIKVFIWGEYDQSIIGRIYKSLDDLDNKINKYKNKNKHST
ncbi:MAG: TIM barrel protein [Clostridia bacterium]